MRYRICKGNDYILGVTTKKGITFFSITNKEKKECFLLLYSKNGKDTERIPMQAGENYGTIYTVGIEGLPLEEYDYGYEIDGKPVADPRAQVIVGREEWGDETRTADEIKCGFNYKSFSWGGDHLPRISKNDMVMYKLHVRGFSMQQKIAEEERGTFRGIQRKIPYLQALGVTTVELMPIYEFEELFAKDPWQCEKLPPNKLNYWGYTGGDYFAVKAAYLGKGNTSQELKLLVKKLHQKNMECILEFYFKADLNPHYIIDVLRYWSREFHIDGFHVICDRKLVELIAADPYLNGRKLFFEWFPEEYADSGQPEMELFSYNDEFLYGIRKFINQQGGTMLEFTNQLRKQQKNQGFVNYLAAHNGFTLYDSFTYTEKQNWDNGENNQDGIVWNYSVNCGEEGPSKRKQVNQLRECQIKNALCCLMFAQGVPLIWMGDECGNTQNGNNNAYCQDNEIGWKEWSNTKKSRILTDFVKRLTELRRRYPILRNAHPLEQQDYYRMGYPDLSYHSGSGWQMELRGGDKAVGLMYNCRYAGKTGVVLPEEIEKERKRQRENKKINDDYIYVGYNFSAVDQELALPVLPKNYKWHYLLDTSKQDCFQQSRMDADARTFLIESVSVCMLAACQEG